MPQFLVAIYHPNNFDPNTHENQSTREDITALNREMVAAGIRVYVGGLTPVIEAQSIRRDARGEMMVTDGPYSEAKEHIGGFWVLETKDMTEAVEWGRKAAIACRTPVEVRAFN
jgi:hypothetical protein